MSNSTNTDVLQAVVPMVKAYDLDVYQVTTSTTQVTIKVDELDFKDDARFDIIIDKDFLSEAIIMNQIEMVLKLI